MSSDIFKELLKGHIETFVIKYIRHSKNLFLDQNGERCKNGSLPIYHNGEYGSYRENLIKELLLPVLPKRLDIGNGFIITSEGNVSTQCDLIIYDRNSTPVIDNGIQKFFPVECVAGVIEAKSTITCKDLSEHLKKLSKIKSLRKDINKEQAVISFCNQSDEKRPFDPGTTLQDRLATFLVCEKIEGKPAEIMQAIKDAYSDIDKGLWHNMVLSINDGCFLYDKGNDDGGYAPFPFENVKNQRIKSIEPAENGYEYEHIMRFMNLLNQVVEMTTLVMFDYTLYIGKDLGEIKTSTL